MGSIASLRVGVYQDVVSRSLDQDGTLTVWLKGISGSSRRQLRTGNPSQQLTSTGECIAKVLVAL